MNFDHRRWAWMSWLGLLGLIVAAAARGAGSDRFVEHLIFEDHGGKTGIRIDLPLAAAYVKHYPQRAAQVFEIKLEAINPPTLDSAHFAERGLLFAPPAEGMPLMSVSYELDLPREILLIVRFLEPVEISVRERKDHRSLLIYLPDVPFSPAVSGQTERDIAGNMPDPGDERIEKLMAFGRKALEDGKGSQAAAVFLDILQLPPNPFTHEAETLYRASQLGPAQDRVQNSERFFTLEELEPLLEDGRTALEHGDFKNAIVAYSKLNELPENPYTRESLEMLGVARQRRGQIAHAKATYLEYLQRYPDGEDSARVKQRLTDMIANELPARAPLPAAQQEASGQAELKTDVFTTLSQSYYHGTITFDDQPNKETDESTLLSFVTMSTRTRGKRYDVRTEAYIGNTYDKLDKDDIDNGRAQISSLYADVKNNERNYTARVGRQPGILPGVYGRFDGGSLRYDLNKTLRIDVTAGYPRELTNADSVDRGTRFVVTGMEWENLYNKLDVAPYVLVQDTAGIPDRRAVGEEVRYADGRFSLFSTLEYDKLYHTINLALLNGQWRITDGTDTYLLLDQRKSPLLSVKNALLDDNATMTLDDLSATGSAQDLRDSARQRTGKSTLLTMGVSHLLANAVQLSFDASRSTQRFSEASVAADPRSDWEDVSGQYNVRATMPSLVSEQGITVFGASYTTADQYTGTAFLIQNRSPVALGWRVDSRLRFDARRAKTGTRYRRLRPAMAVSYTRQRWFNLDMELGYENLDYSGESQNPDAKRVAYSLAYRWSF